MVRVMEMTHCTLYFPKFDRNRGSHWMHFACICHIVFCMFSCLKISWQPFYLHQLLKFHPLDWLIEIYLQTESQGTHHKMVSFQPVPGFPPLSAVLIQNAFDDSQPMQKMPKMLLDISFLINNFINDQLALNLGDICVDNTVIQILRKSLSCILQKCRRFTTEQSPKFGF